jgi:hypothetical protein
VSQVGDGTMDMRFIKLQREGGGPPSEVMINSSLVRYIEDVTVEGGPARARISFAADDKVVVSGTVVRNESLCRKFIDGAI